MWETNNCLLTDFCYGVEKSRKFPQMVHKITNMTKEVTSGTSEIYNMKDDVETHLYLCYIKVSMWKHKCLSANLNTASQILDIL